MSIELWTLTLKGDDIEAYTTLSHELVPDFLNYAHGIQEEWKGHMLQSPNEERVCWKFTKVQSMQLHHHGPCSSKVPECQKMDKLQGQVSKSKEPQNDGLVLELNVVLKSAAESEMVGHVQGERPKGSWITSCFKADEKSLMTSYCRDFPEYFLISVVYLIAREAKLPRIAKPQLNGYEEERPLSNELMVKFYVFDRKLDSHHWRYVLTCSKMIKAEQPKPSDSSGNQIPDGNGTKTTKPEGSKILRQRDVARHGCRYAGGYASSLCYRDFGAVGITHLPLIEFSIIHLPHNIKLHTIRLGTGGTCRCPRNMDGSWKSPLIGPEIVQETTEKIFKSKKDLKTQEVATRESYADKTRCEKAQAKKDSHYKSFVERSQGAEYTWETRRNHFPDKISASFLRTHTFVKCHNLSLEDKAHLTGKDCNIPYFQVLGDKTEGDRNRKKEKKDAAEEGWTVVCQNRKIKKLGLISIVFRKGRHKETVGHNVQTAMIGISSADDYLAFLLALLIFLIVNDDNILSKEEDFVDLKPEIIDV
ncbi:hypothetical protein Tco_0725354 [Tanacetum coccineum]|uniref:Uncharacterized protein n=1 Tax=Tanacetum coccineum TaxID=301880 RepID=A0ABQ4YE31_9ASTR